MNKPRIILSLALSSFMALMCGCGERDGIKRVRVTGTVTVGSSEPFANGLVIFTPQGKDSKILGGSATTDDDGRFTLRHVKGQMGIEPGDYVVIFSKIMMPDGSEPPSPPDNDPDASPQSMGAVQFVPPEYSSAQAKKYPVTIEDKGDNLEFDIPKLEPQTPKKPMRNPQSR